jgi:hypothetical protein
MATKKQRAANRRNAKKSTGPRTAAGKAKSAQNATQHGLLARRAVLSDEDGAAYEEWRLTLIHELWPESPLETLIVNRIAAAQWRLARVPGIEVELLERLRRDGLGRDEGLGAAWARDAGSYGGALARLARYETMLERSVARGLEELRRLQRERSRAERGDRAEAQAAGRAEQGPWWERAAAAWPGAPRPKPAAEGDGLPGDGNGAAAILRNEPTARPAGTPGAATPGAAPARSSRPYGANGSGTPGAAPGGHAARRVQPSTNGNA